MTRLQPDDIHQIIVEWARAGRPFAIALVLEAHGSTPRKAGTKAVIDAAGCIYGTIGGGPVEAQAQQLAIEAIRRGRAASFAVNLDASAVEQGKPICGGRMRVLLDPAPNLHRAAYAAALESRRWRKPGVLLTTYRGGRKPQVKVQFLPASAISPAMKRPGLKAARLALESGQARLHVLDSVQPAALEVLAEPLIIPPLLLLVGGGHVGQAVAIQASLVGFEIVVIDDRPEFTAPGLFPAGVATRCGPVADELAAFRFGPDTFIVIVTRGHRQDAEALAACLRKPVAYIGMIGSRRKVALIRKKFLASGQATEAEFDRLHAPIGLDIGAITVPEIAASIIAQLIAVRRTGRSPRLAGGPSDT